MDLSIVLQNTLSPDQSIRHHASRMLEEAVCSTGLPSYLHTLVGLLGTDTQTAAVRIAAGLAAKNALVNRRDAAKQADMAQGWLELPDTVRRPIRNAALQALGATSPAVGTTAAQVVAAIACIELPAGDWPDLLPTLVSHMTSFEQIAALKRASVETIGFICEEADRIGATLESHSNAILTAVINGVQSGEAGVRIASCKALLNSLEFASSAFSNPTERAYIMQRVCETAAQTTSEELSVAALQCIVRIVNLYYHCLADFMAGGLQQLAISAMQRMDSPSTQLQAIEFWSTVCEVELDLQEQLEDEKNGSETSPASLDFALSALPRLLPVLLWLLTQQSDDYGEASGSSDDWTPAMAAATCLSLLANTIGDAIVTGGNLLAFVQSNIQDRSDWRKREAAAMAFGSVLDGPDPQHMMSLVRTALPLFTSLLSDDSVAVRDTTAWCIGEACSGYVEAVTPDLLPTLIQSLIRGLQDRPRVAANCAWAAAHLVEQLNDSAMVDPALFTHVMQGLLQAAMRGDSGEANLRTCAFQALANVVAVAPLSALPMVEQLAAYLVSQLESLSSTPPVNADDRIRTQELQGHYSAVLQSAVKVLNGDQVAAFSDRLMAAVLAQLSPIIVGAASRPPTPMTDNSVDPTVSSGANAAAWEDLLLLLGAVIDVSGQRASKYMDNVAPVLAAALSGAYHLESSLCIVAIIDIGEAAQALKSEFSKMALPFIQLLASILSSSSVGQSVKPKAISAVGDIALAIGPAFCTIPHLPSTIMPILMQAAQAVTQPPSDLDDWEHVDFVLEMRSALVEAFTCIVQGTSDDQSALQALAPSISHIMSFLKAITVLPQTEYEVMVGDPLVRTVIGLIGDIVMAYGKGPAATPLKEPWIGTFLANQGRRRNLPDSIDSVLRWTSSQIARI